MTTETDSQFTWQAHPARERSGHAAAGAAVVLACGAAVYAAYGSIAWSLLALVVLFAALNRFFFSSHFQIDEEGITARYLFGSRRFQWRDVHRFVVDNHGGYLSTRSRASRLDAYRGLHILFGQSRPAVIERIRAHLPGGDE